MPSIDIKRFTKSRTSEKGHFSNNEQDRFAFLSQELFIRNSKLADKKKETFFLELGSLIEAGIDMKTCLELILNDHKKREDKILFESIKNAVVTGASVAEGLKQSGKFSKYEILTITIGEESGKLVEVLKELAHYYNQKVKQRRRLISSMTYPMIIVFTSLGAVFFMLKFVVPMFTDIFKRFGGKLPWITKVIISSSKLLENNFYLILCLLAILTGIYFKVRKTITFRHNSSKILLKIPLAGDLLKKIYLARFCNSMRLLINAQVPLLNCIVLAKGVINFYPIESALEQVETDILKGMDLNESLKQFDIFPSKMTQLLRIGEETSQLDFFFGKLADQYIEEVEFKTTALSTAMEPLIILFLGLIVGTILVAMYLPLFQLGNSIQ